MQKLKMFINIYLSYINYENHKHKNRFCQSVF